MKLPISENPTNTGLLVASLTALLGCREKLENSKLADRVGFEPTEGCPSTVFKTAAIDHSATYPLVF